MRAPLARLIGPFGPQLMQSPHTDAGTGAIIATTSTTDSFNMLPSNSPGMTAKKPIVCGGGSRGVRLHKSDGHGFCDPDPVDATGDGIPRCEQ